MRKLRDIVYINSNLSENEFIYYGIDFKDFMKAINIPIENILLLKHNYWGKGLEIKSNLETVTGEGIIEFIEENVYNFGDFCWVDFKSEEGLDSLEPLEIAKLLYLGQMKHPIGLPFFDRIENRFAYCAHGDGWFCRLFCRETSEFQEVLAEKIIGTVKTSKRRKVYPVSHDVLNQLLGLSQNGLLIDFCNLIKNESQIEIPIYTIGKFLDMDMMYNDLRRHVGRASYSASLVHKNKKWTIVEW